MGFNPVTVPLAGGHDLNASQFAATGPLLTNVTNVVFTKKGELSVRPSATRRGNAKAQTGGAGTALSALDLDAGGVSVSTPMGIFAAPFPGVFGAQSPLLMFSGSAFIRRGANWTKIGEPLPMRVSRSGGMSPQRIYDANRIGPVPVGPSLVGVLSTVGGYKGMPVLGVDDELLGVSTATLVNYMENASSIANNAMFYITTAGDIRVQIPGTLPTATDSLIASTTASVGTNQGISAFYDSTNDAYIVAWVSSVAGRITINRVSNTGTVTAALDVGGLGTIVGCAIAGSPFTGTRFALAWIDTAAAAGSRMKTKVFSYTSSAITDAAIDLNYANPHTSIIYYNYCLSASTTNNHVSLMYHTDVGSCVLLNRSMTAATTNPGGVTLYGRLNGTDDGNIYEPLFPPIQMANGRTVAGFMHSAAKFVTSGTTTGHPLRHSAQWIVMDVTDAMGAAGIALQKRRVLAYSQAARCERTSARPAALASNGDLLFGIWEGVTFDAIQGVTAAIARRVRLSPQAPASLDAGGLMYFTSAGGLTFDGTDLKTQGFVETYPYIHLNSSAGGAGALVVGSYTYQVTWELTNGQGSVVRSGASEPFTYALGAGAQYVQVFATVPQFLEYPTTQATVRVKLYATEVNPSAGAPLYFVASSELTALPVSNQVTLVHTDPVDTTQEQLYTGGDILDDEPMPAGDRGVALAMERIWVADQSTVYASKAIRPGIAPAWSTSGILSLSIPGALGDIQGLSGTDDRLYVVCTNGVAVVQGAGFDDFGVGPGWAVSTVNGLGSGIITPRQVITTPAGCVFEARTNGIFVVSGSSVERISSRGNNSIVVGDLAYVATSVDPNGGEGHQMLFHCGRKASGRGVQMYDMDVDQWADWFTLIPTTSGGDAYWVGMNGVLWLQTTNQVWSYDGNSGSEGLGPTAINMWFGTSAIRPAQGVSGWGRLRKVVLHGTKNVADTLTAQVSLTFDENQDTYTYTESWGPDPADDQWPRSTSFEVWPEVQRCSSVSVFITIANAANVRLHAIDLWVAQGSDQAPQTNRG